MSTAGKLNFKGVEEAKETVMTEPGTKDIFDITEVKFDSSKNKGTYYMGVTFSRKADKFNHSFFLTEKALPRVKSLVKYATGKELDDELSEAQLIKMLEGRKIALKVTAKFDETNGRAYADLPFGGFGKTPDELEALEFTDREKADIAKAKEMRSKANTSEADGPTTKGTGSAPASKPASSGAGKADDDIF
jgi:hypothetical protein